MNAQNLTTYTTMQLVKPKRLPDAPVSQPLTDKAKANLDALERAKAENPAFPALALALRERSMTEGRIRKQHNGRMPNTSEALDAARHAKYAAMVDQVELLMSSSPITCADLSEITGLSKSTIRRVLIGLVDAGKVAPIARGRGHMAYALTKVGAQ